MTYKDTVISCLVNYPSLFENRLYVDDHLFAVIGNGYKWIGGQIVEEDFEENEDGEYTNITQPDYDTRLTDYYNDYDKQYNNYNLECVSGIPCLIRRIYSICDCSLLAKIPDDIQDDWLDAVEKFVDFCIRNHDYITNYNANIMRERLKAKFKITKIRNSR